MPERHWYVRRFAAALAIVAAIDLVSKQVATLLLAGGAIRLFGPLDLALTYNRGSAFGISLGPYTWQLNVLATCAALALSAMALRALSAIDRQAPLALGFIGGAALGNLTSLLLPPAGVADFFALRVSATGRIVMNVADLAAYAGLALIVRSGLLLHRELLARRARARVAAQEAEVPIPLFADGILETRAASLLAIQDRLSSPRRAADATREARRPERAD